MHQAPYSYTQAHTYGMYSGPMDYLTSPQMPRDSSHSPQNNASPHNGGNMRMGGGVLSPIMNPSMMGTNESNNSLYQRRMHAKHTADASNNDDTYNMINSRNVGITPQIAIPTLPNGNNSGVTHPPMYYTSQYNPASHAHAYIAPQHFYARTAHIHPVPHPQQPPPPLQPQHQYYTTSTAVHHQHMPRGPPIWSPPRSAPINSLRQPSSSTSTMYRLALPTSTHLAERISSGSTLQQHHSPLSVDSTVLTRDNCGVMGQESSPSSDRGASASATASTPAKDSGKHVGVGIGARMRAEKEECSSSPDFDTNTGYNSTSSAISSEVEFNTPSPPLSAGITVGITTGEAAAAATAEEGNVNAGVSGADVPSSSSTMAGEKRYLSLTGGSASSAPSSPCLLIPDGFTSADISDKIDEIPSYFPTDPTVGLPITTPSTPPPPPPHSTNLSHHDHAFLLDPLTTSCSYFDLNTNYSTAINPYRRHAYSSAVASHHSAHFFTPSPCPPQPQPHDCSSSATQQRYPRPSQWTTTHNIRTPTDDNCRTPKNRTIDLTSAPPGFPETGMTVSVSAGLQQHASANYNGENGTASGGKLMRSHTAPSDVPPLKPGEKSLMSADEIADAMLYFNDPVDRVLSPFIPTETRSNRYTYATENGGGSAGAVSGNSNESDSPSGFYQTATTVGGGSTVVTNAYGSTISTPPTKSPPSRPDDGEIVTMMQNTHLSTPPPGLPPVPPATRSGEDNCENFTLGDEVMTGPNRKGTIVKLDWQCSPPRAEVRMHNNNCVLNVNLRNILLLRQENEYALDKVSRTEITAATERQQADLAQVDETATEVGERPVSQLTGHKKLSDETLMKLPHLRKHKEYIKTIDVNMGPKDYNAYRVNLNGACDNNNGSSNGGGSNIATPMGSLKENMMGHNIGNLNAGMQRKQKKNFVTEKGDLYKTELCENWVTKGHCTYGRKCHFAHGFEDIRHRVRVANYKTQPCCDPARADSRLCLFGKRCNYAHPGEPLRQPMESEYLDSEYFERLKREYKEPHPFGMYI